MIISVNGYEEAKSYPVMFNNSELLMDNNRDVFYVKSVDNMGKSVINSYKFEKIENEKPMDPSCFATKEQLDALSFKLDDILNKIGSAKNGK